MIEIKQIEKIIKDIKIPLTLLLSLILNSDNILPENYKIAIKLFIKYHYKTIISYPIIKLFISFKKEIPDDIIKYYKNYIKMAKCIENIKVLQDNFNKYKNLSLIDFEKKINEEKNIFNSYFDATFASNNFHNKLLQYFCSDDVNNTINYEIKKRLKDSLKLIGYNFAVHFKIPILIIDEYNNMNGIEKFKFIDKYFEMVNKTFQTITLNLKKVEVYKSILSNIIQTKKLNVTINNRLDSETENDDLEIFLM